jgi:hypothetical protein
VDRVDAYTRIASFYSDQYDVSLEYVGYAPRWDRVVHRGDLARGTFVAFWLTDGFVAAGMSVGVPGAAEPLRALVASREPANVDHLSDPAVSLEDLVALTATGSAATVIGPLPDVPRRGTRSALQMSSIEPAPAKESAR